MRKKLLRAISEQGFDLDGGATGTLSMMPDEVEEEEKEEDSDEATNMIRLEIEYYMCGTCVQIPG